MDIHDIQEILLVASGIVLLIVAVAVAAVVVIHLIGNQGTTVPRRRPSGHDERPSDEPSGR